ncbi:SusD/RagB family nutrient-binding outer membrane lipoprotein [Mucilaginibacter ximonensis]|uniref:SusD/RagB family nutrient-binding outer membrane lipoprotein n=1 Tax=Mucilaginibacter ximonensis TaxID=538021 RepID=A0ABW5YG44_9SPHI
MKKSIFALLTALAITMAGCKKFSDFQTDPNKSTTATPDLLLNNVEQSAFQSTSLDITLAVRQMVVTEEASSYQYYNWQRGDYGNYDKLRQVLKMEQSAALLNQSQYQPIAKFFRAWYFLQLTQTFGDIPYSQALMGESNVFKPVYDKQQDIYVAILNDLKTANSMITAATPAVQGDIVYGGNMQQWKKAINSLSLRVLMSLSIKAGNASYDFKQRFAEIVNNPSQYPIFTSNTDNAQLKFYDLDNDRYPYFNSNGIQTAYYMEKSFVTLLQQLKDARLFSFAQKAPNHATAPDGDFTAYGGIKGSDPVDVNAKQQVSGEISRINPRFYNSPTNEPSIALGYPELQFILAEGVTRGWISGDANTYYKNGIQASMSFYAIDATTIATYIAQPAVQLNGSNNIQQIITQKYIASFMNSGWQPFYENRRTGFPVFDVSGDGVLNNKMIPKRFMYPQTELQLNQQNVSDAIKRQYPGGDDINGMMWLIQP